LEIKTLEQICNFNSYTHFSFDLWLTLLKSNPEYKKKLVVLFKDFFEIDASLEQIATTVRYYDVACNTINEKTGSHLDTFEIYLLILNALQVTISDIKEEKLEHFYQETESLFMNYKPLLIFPDTRKVLHAMNIAGKSANVLSNNGFLKGKTMRKLLSFYEIDSYFDFQLYSDETGFSKPNPKMFALVWEHIQNKKELFKTNVLHIGDNEIADYQGAKNFGFDAFLLKI